MKRIYHHHKKWEEVKYCMYDNYNTKQEDILIKKVVDYFNKENLVKKYMRFVVNNFKFSCEHNFTNPSMNKIAFLGQASVSAYLKIPREITMKAWNLLSERTQNRANSIAIKEIERWDKCQKNI